MKSSITTEQKPTDNKELLIDGFVSDEEDSLIGNFDKLLNEYKTDIKNGQTWKLRKSTL